MTSTALLDTRAALAPDVAELVALVRGRRTAVLTGAGLSTDSGIPDYRGPGSAPRNPMTYQQFTGDPAFRRHYWARNHVGWRHMAATRPNDGHRALAALERAGAVSGVVTQNVDTLHRRAGSQNLVDLHGSYDRVRCLACGYTVSRESLDVRLTALNPGFREAQGVVDDIEIAPDADAVVESTASFVVADCERCGGMLKPDIVYFGETVPREKVARSYEIVDDADVLLVAGSSLTVHSGLRYARHAVRSGKPLAIINRGATRADDIATVRLDAGTSETLTALLPHLLPTPPRPAG
ncbi:NAD-dependent SIR2 family protein deacetylase [Flavimobilis soli]|uniref:NAD-dependent protein deacetylase n=1 Tax=Flavimobilis soli TaxID=442709 RepID=A0A2A9EEK6_9MICO|nr:NAD-dependent protein deacetylase [Flavimobilis soli]PFG36659.1 NAD-dependent SIR2 family protein deacetylase [Flavimobilis soli]